MVIRPLPPHPVVTQTLSPTLPELIFPVKILRLCWADVGLTTAGRSLVCVV